MSLSISEEDILSFVYKPNFRVDSIVPEDSSNETWQDCVGDIGVYLSGLRGRDMIYQQSKKRYQILFAQRHVLFAVKGMKAAFAIILSEALFWLGDYHSTLSVLLTIDIGRDEQLNTLICMVRGSIAQLERDEIEAEHDSVDENGKTVFHVLPPGQPPACEPSADLTEVHQRWSMCKSEVGETLARDLFARHTCISTNELEDVFEVEGSTWHRLVRKGFLEISIVGISQNSKIKNGKRIIRVLKNTNKCVDRVGDVLSNYSEYSEDFIKNIHATLIEGENFEAEYNDEGLEECIMVIPAGEYRRVGCYTTHYASGRELTEPGTRVQYCKFRDIPRLMKDYCRQAVELLNNDSVDIFLKAAWLQWAFLCIHPFADGNGRVSRIISSVPLVKEYLPPIVVLKADKGKYFDCLDQADRTGNLMPLRDFLRESQLRGMQYTSEVGRQPEPADAPLDAVRARIRARAGSNHSSSSSHSGDSAPASKTPSPTASPTKVN